MREVLKLARATGDTGGILKRFLEMKKVKTHDDLAVTKNNPAQDIVESLRERYEVDCKWRDLWVCLLNKPNSNRLESRQDAIERKAVIANNRITSLMLLFDAACE